MKNVIQKMLLMLLVFVMLASTCYADDVPYTTYNYDYWENIVYTPAAYIPDGKIDGATILDENGEAIGGFVTPNDVYLGKDNHLYIVDSGNNRVVVLNADDYSLIHIIEGFDNNGVAETLKNPMGVCISENEDGFIYIADADNYRVVILNSDYTLNTIVENPQREDNVLEDNFIFCPQKLIVDSAGRLYVIAKNTEEGILVFNENLEFENYFGTISVSISTWERVWRKLSTKAQRQKQALKISTEFNGLDVDDDGFIYASFADTNGVQGVKRLNPKGLDVIKKGYNEHTGGDIGQYNATGSYDGMSRAIDVCYCENGIYSFLDSRRGRVFTYDHEGNLLYVFGGFSDNGAQEGCFKTPKAIEKNKEQLMVADSTLNIVLLFKPTEYGSLINEAVGLRYDGDEATAVPVWENVLKYDANFELAYVGLGKAYLSAGDNKKAMEYLELGMSKQYYSIAFRRYRNEFLVGNLEWILTLAVVLVIGGVAFKKWRNRNKYTDNSADTLE